MIIQISFSNKTKEYNLNSYGKSTITFGRHKTNDIVIDDINASREHGYFQKINHEWVICDNNSTNGIVVNGEIIHEKKLYTNDFVILSVKKQDKAVHIKILNDEYNVSDRVDNPRSMSRYFRMTNDMTDVLKGNNINSTAPYNSEDNTTLLQSNKKTYDSEESTTLLNPNIQYSNGQYINTHYSNSEDNSAFIQPDYNYTYSDSNYIDRSISFPNNTTSTKDSKKGKKIALISGISIFAVVLIVMGIVFLPKLIKGRSDNYLSDNSKKDTEEITKDNTETKVETTTEAEVEEIEFNEPFLIDYTILANYLEDEDVSYYDDPYNMEPGPYMPSEIIDGFEVYDIDDDGIEELLIKTSLVINNNDGQRKVLYTFDAVDGNYTEWRDVSVAGDSDLYICESDKKAYLHKGYYTAGYTYETYNIWTIEGWIEGNTFEKSQDEILTCKWDGKSVSEDEWLNNSRKMDYREINDNMLDLLYLNTESNPEVTADSIYDYYKNEKKINAYKIKKDEEEYYIVLSDYFNKIWKNQKNTDYKYDDYSFEDFESNPCIIIAVKEDKNGSIINIYMIDDRHNITNVIYDNGIVITDSNVDYLYEIEDGAVEYKKKLTLDDVEEKLISNKWYTLNSGNNAEIKEYVFYENGEVESIIYNYDNGKWVKDISSTYHYTYNPSDKQIYINMVQDGLNYYYDSNYGVFVGDLSHFTYDGKNNYYEKCLISYDNFPDFNTLNNNCHNVLSGNPIDEVPQPTTEQESNDSQGALTQEQVYQAVVNYCCEQNPSLNDMMGDDSYTLYWVIGELEGDYYTVDYRSYTAAHVYYHVNIYSGDVYTTEFVPGITDGEVPGGEAFNAWNYVN